MPPADRFDPGDLGPDLDDPTRALTPKHERQWPWVGAGALVHVDEVDSDSGHVHPNVPGRQRIRLALGKGEHARLAIADHLDGSHRCPTTLV